MDSSEMKARTKRFALRIVRLSAALPKDRAGDVLGRQILKSGTSIGANYREAIRASSKRHFISTLEIAIREAEETIYWLELLSEAEIVASARLQGLMDECGELLAILTSTVRTAKRKEKTAKAASGKLAKTSPFQISNLKSAIINPK
jgi:four helix bundle protein